jgi:hypothetical protein
LPNLVCWAIQFVRGPTNHLCKLNENSYNYNDSYSNIIWPCCRKWNIIANWTTFLVFFLTTPCANCAPIVYQLWEIKTFWFLASLTLCNNTSPFFKLNLVILSAFLQYTRLPQKIPFKNKQFVFSFYLNTNSTFDNVQTSTFPITYSSSWEFCGILQFICLGTF